MAEVRKTFEAERIDLAMAAREREQALIEHLHNQTAAVKQQVEMEAEHNTENYWFLRDRPSRWQPMNLLTPCGRRCCRGGQSRRRTNR
eukprot:7812578-Pyramimonas_sp.AAC.1